MKYERFEIWAIGVGALVVVSALVASLGPAPDYIEIVGQLLLLAVLVAAIHWGRRGGTIATVCASVVYIAMRLPSLAVTGLTSAELRVILVRIATYGLVGILGGEACSRVKYVLARLQDDCSIDDMSRVYNQRFTSKMLLESLSAFKRYGAVFAVVVVDIAPSVTAGLSPTRTARLVRTVADYLRNDVRLVDNVGRLEDGRFVVLLPQTPRDGAVVASTRLRRGVCETIGARQQSVTHTVMGAAEDLEAIEALVDGIYGVSEAVVQPATAK